MASEDEDVCDQLRARMARDPACAPDLEALARAQARHRTTLVKQFARRYGLPPQAGCATGAWRGRENCCAAACRWPTPRMPWASPTRRT